MLYDNKLVYVKNAVYSHAYYEYTKSVVNIYSKTQNCEMYKQTVAQNRTFKMKYLHCAKMFPGLKKRAWTWQNFIRYGHSGQKC